MYQPGETPSEHMSSATAYSSGSQPSEANAGRQETSGQEAAGAMRKLKQKSGDLRESAMETVHSVAGRAREEAGAVFERIKHEGEAAINRGKDRAADGIGRFASAIREAADRLHQEGDHNLADYTEDVCNQLDRAAGYLRERDVSTLADELGDVVRRRPGIFFAGLFVGGVVAARLLKTPRATYRDVESSSEHDREREEGAGPSGPPSDLQSSTGMTPGPAEPGISPRPVEMGPEGPEPGGPDPDRVEPQI
jgi:hypothetical protein